MPPSGPWSGFGSGSRSRTVVSFREFIHKSSRRACPDGRDEAPDFIGRERATFSGNNCGEVRTKRQKTVERQNFGGVKFEY
jgi:hypothetical protein